MKKIIIIFFLFSFLFGQEVKKTPLQVSLIYPVGTSWTKSKERQFNFSLNLLAGYTGQIKGVELGLININKYDVTGMQLGGFNLVQRHFKGFQFAPLANINLGNATGATFSGGLTFQKGDFKGFQFSFFVNVNTGNMYGAMGSHIVNYVHKDMFGIQYALGPNIVRENAKGIQVSLVTGNFVRNEFDGLQLGLFGNYAGSSKGLQVGLINLAPHKSNWQVGLINYTKDTTSKTLGLINIVPRGYNKLEVWSNELNVFNIGFKMGGKTVYSMINIGGNPFNKNKFWSIGWGPGFHVQFTKKFYGDFDNILSWVSVNQPFNTKFNQMTLFNQTRLLCGIELGKKNKIALFLGPTFNFMWSNNADIIQLGYAPLIPNEIVRLELPPTFRTFYFNAGKFYGAFWPGICGGIRFF